jgi:hypothetical protein
MSPEATRLVRRCAEHHPRYAGGLSDHLPMALCALDGLGRPPSQVETFYQHYRSRLLALKPTAASIDGAWKQNLEQIDSYEAYLAYFLDAVDAMGADAVVRQHLPELIGGLAADAFHPLIRLGYAIDFGVDSEIAAGLSYLAAAHLPLASESFRVTNLDLESLLVSLADDAELRGFSFEGRMFSDRLAELARAGLVPAPATVEAPGVIASTVLWIHRNTRNFFALHLVTAFHALGVCLPYLVSPEPALACFQRAVAASCVAVGTPRFDRPSVADDVWLERMRRDPEHVYKYAYSCRQEHAHWGDPAYRGEYELLERTGLLDG